MYDHGGGTGTITVVTQMHDHHGGADARLSRRRRSMITGDA